MKLLLDENLPHRLRPFLIGHDSYTVAFMGWSSVKNGKLLSLAADHGFDCLLTKDTNLSFQQDVKKLPLAVVLIEGPSNDLEDIRPVVPKLLATLETLEPNSLTVVAAD